MQSSHRRGGSEIAGAAASALFPRTQQVLHRSREARGCRVLLVPGRHAARAGMAPGSPSLHCPGKRGGNDAEALGGPGYR